MNKRTRAAAFGVGTALAAALGSLAYPLFFRHRCLTWGARPDEVSRKLPGDDLLADADIVSTRVITIDAPPAAIWPWLVQMGSGRDGWYAYDFIDNGGQCSAERILPNYQNIGVGSVLPPLPGANDVFLVAQCGRDRSLVLAWRLPSGKYQTTWAFVLEQPQPRQTRLTVRGRVTHGHCSSS